MAISLPPPLPLNYDPLTGNACVPDTYLPLSFSAINNGTFATGDQPLFRAYGLPSGYILDPDPDNYLVTWTVRDDPANPPIYVGGFVNDSGVSPLSITVQTYWENQVQLAFSVWGTGSYFATAPSFCVPIIAGDALDPPPPGFLSGERWEVEATRVRRIEDAMTDRLGQRIGLTIPRLDFVARGSLVVGERFRFTQHEGPTGPPRWNQVVQYQLASMPGTTAAGGDAYLTWDVAGSGWDDGLWGA